MKLLSIGNSFSQDAHNKLHALAKANGVTLETVNLYIGGCSLERVALGKRIRESRIKKGYTQQDLAGKADIGVVYLSEIERGVKMPSLNIFIKIIDALDVSADYILRDEVSSGKEYICMEITEKLLVLTPGQRKTATDILSAYLNNLP